MRSLTSLAVAAALAFGGCGSAPPRDSGVPEGASAAAESPARPAETQPAPFKARVGRLDIEVSLASTLRSQIHEPPKPGDGMLLGIAGAAGALLYPPAWLAVPVMPVVGLIAEGYWAGARADGQTVATVFARNDYPGLIGTALAARLATDAGQGISTRKLTITVDQYGLQLENFGFGQYRPEAMLEATRASQRLLVSQGMPEEKARHYVVVGDYSQTRKRGHLLIAVVYRHTAMQPFRVTSKQTGIVTTLRPEQMGWRSPYERDVNGQAIDEVIDWVGIEYATLKQDRLVATLMVIAAESVKSGKRSPDYWQAERRWIAGATTQVMAESSDRVKRALSVS